MEFLLKFPVMERSALAELRKGIDLAFREFSRAYGDGIEAFFDPLFFFFSKIRKIINQFTLANNNYYNLWLSMDWFKKLETCCWNSCCIFASLVILACGKIVWQH